MCSYGRDMCINVCFGECVCVFWSPFLSVEEKRGRQLAEIEGDDCDLRTKSRAKCFLSLLFSPLFCLSVLAASFSFSRSPLLSSLRLSSEPRNRDAPEKKQRARNRFLTNFFFPLSASKRPSLKARHILYGAPSGRT